MSPRKLASIRRIGRICAWLALGVLAGWGALHWVPLPAALLAPLPPSLELTDRLGQPLRAVLADERRYSRDAANLPAHLLDATIAAEDQRFWHHPGFDLLATARAAWDFARQRRVVSGASTIAQQLIKISEPRPRTLRTKLCEAAQALRLTQLWPRERIVAEYLNRLDYGSLSIGCTAASATYFAKPPRDLSLAEAAFLAGLPQAPTRLDPRTRLPLAIKRQHYVLARMLDLGLITAEEHGRALAEPLRLAPAPRVFRAPHFVDLVLRDRPGLSGIVTTTLDLELNGFVERALREQLRAQAAHHVRDGAVVVLDNRTGDVLGLVGSGDWFAPGSGQVNGATAPRSAGSTLKPFTYLLAFERGTTPATLLADVPAQFATGSGIYRPQNYSRAFLGPVRARLALANSLNVPAVRLLADAGGASVLKNRLLELGMTTLARDASDYGLGLTIGNAEVRLLELANAYATLARLGEQLPTRFLATDLRPAATRVCDPTAAWLIADILADNSARALAFGLDSPLRFDFPVACKTGTSTSFRDNWALGYTPEFTVGVWVGNFDGSPMRDISGVTGAGPILHDVFEWVHARRGTSWYLQPADIVKKRIDPASGALSEGGTIEPFDARFLPPHDDSRDEQGRVLLDSQYREWLGASNTPAFAIRQDPAALRIVEPLPGATYYIDPDLPESSQWIPLQAIAPPGAIWASDTLECRANRAHLAPGRHRLTVETPAGLMRETWIAVKDL